MPVVRPQRERLDAERSGYRNCMEAVVTIAAVEAVKTRSGTIRFVVKDTDGNDYTTFRESIG